MAASAWLSLLTLCCGTGSSVAVQTGGVAGTALTTSKRAAKAGGPFYLGSDIPYDSCSASGTCLVDGGATIGGTYYSKSIYAHAQSTVTFTLGGVYNAFSTCIGIRESGSCGTTSGDATFEVKADGVQLYYRYSVDYDDPPICFDLDITGTTTLQLLTAYGNSAGTCDHTVWVDPTVTSYWYLGTDVAWSSCSNNPCYADRAHSSATFNIGGTVYPKGVSTHATGTMTFPLSGGYTVIVHGKTDNGISYLNFRASNLEQAETSIGGLLGDDDDTSWAEEFPEACRGHSRVGTL